MECLQLQEQRWTEGGRAWQHDVSETKTMMRPQSKKRMFYITAGARPQHACPSPRPLEQSSNPWHCPKHGKTPSQESTGTRRQSIQLSVVTSRTHQDHPLRYSLKPKTHHSLRRATPAIPPRKPQLCAVRRSAFLSPDLFRNECCHGKPSRHSTASAV